MKTRHLFWLSASGLAIAGFTRSNTLSLADAVKDPQVKINWYHDAGSPHYKTPLIAEIQNNKSVPIAVAIEPGWEVEAEDPAYQNLVISNEQLLVVAPGKTVKKNLHAFCTESQDASGNSETRYRFKPKRNEDLSKLVSFISKKGLQTSEGQQAVWTLLNKTSISEIYGPDTTLGLALQREVAQLRGEPAPAYYQQGSSFRNNYYYRGPLEIELGGYFEYQIAKSKSVEVAMFNERNVLVRELLRKHVSTPGKHRFEYKFDGGAFEEDVYFVRLIVDDRIMLERKIPLKEWKEKFEMNR